MLPEAVCSCSFPAFRTENRVLRHAVLLLPIVYHRQVPYVVRNFSTFHMVPDHKEITYEIMYQNIYIHFYSTICLLSVLIFIYYIAYIYVQKETAILPFRDEPPCVQCGRRDLNPEFLELNNKVFPHYFAYNAHAVCSVVCSGVNFRASSR